MRILNDQILKHLKWSYVNSSHISPARHTNHLEIHQDDVEATKSVYPLKLKTLECTTAVDKAFHGFLRYAYIVELELLELREKKSDVVPICPWYPQEPRLYLGVTGSI